MAFTPPVQTNKANSTGAVNPFTIAYSSNVTKGNLLVAVYSLGGPGNFPTVTPTDTQNNSWNHPISRPDITGADVEMAWAIAGATGPCTLTFTHAGAIGWNVIIAEYAIQNPTLDQLTGSNVGGPLAITTTQSPELIVTGISDGLSGSVFSLSNGFTVDLTSNHNDGGLTPPTTIAIGSFQASPAGAFSTTWSGIQFSGESGMLSFYASANPTKFEVSLFGVKRYGKPQEPECNEIPARKPARLFEVH